MWVKVYCVDNYRSMVDVQVVSFTDLLKSVNDGVRSTSIKFCSQSTFWEV